MKNIYAFLLIFIALFKTSYANCPVNTPPTNLAASSICDKGISTFTGTLNDLNNTLVWLDTANRIIGAGNNFQYYISTLGLNFKAAEVSYDLLSASVAPLPSQFNSTYPSQNFSNGQFFSCLTTLRIDSILLRSNNPLKGNILIWSNAPENGGYILQKHPFNITASGPNNTRVPLSAILTSGSYFMNVEITEGSGILYRALSGANYPYQINNLISITGNNFSTSNDRYYYFFDWDVSKMCMSPVSNSFSPTYIQTVSEEFPYLEYFTNSIPCDWTNTAADPNAIWQQGPSSNFTIPTIDIPTNSGILVSSDINCNCDKSSTKLISPWFDLSTSSKEASISLLTEYFYKEANNSKVYLLARTPSTSFMVIDSFANKTTPFQFGFLFSSFRNYALEDSVQFMIEHRDNGGDSSVFIIDQFYFDNRCSTLINVDVDILLDSYASEISWEIRDLENMEIIAKSAAYSDIIPYNPILARDNRNVCLVKDKRYSFKIMDAFGDGLNDGTNIGNYVLKTDCGDTLLVGAGALPYGGLVLPDMAWDSIVFVAKNYTVDLGKDKTITLDDTLVLDAGPNSTYLWSTGDTTRYISIIGKNLPLGNNDFSVRVKKNMCFSNDTITINIVDVFSPKIKVSLITDTKGSDIKWELRDADTDTLIMSKGPFLDLIPYNINAATHIDSVYVDFNQNLTFKVIDLAGDGLFDGTNQGSIMVSNECVPVIFLNNSKSFPNQEGVSSFDSIAFNANVKPVFNIGNDFEVCANETILLNSNSSAYQYNWKIGNTIKTGNPIEINSNDLATGENVIIVDNNPSISCFASDTIVITKKENPSANFQTTQLGGQLTCTANEVGAISYQWNFGDGATANGKTVVHNYATNGTYTVKLKIINTNSCEDSSTKTVTINGVGVQSNFNSNLELYPNPSNGIVIVKTPKEEQLAFQLFDLQGRIVLEIKPSEHSKEYKLNLHEVDPGSYLIRIISRYGVENRKITLN